MNKRTCHVIDWQRPNSSARRSVFPRRFTPSQRRRRKTSPSYFLAIEQTKNLISEILNAGISAFKTTRGKYGGTYACRELVIASAAWISAEFHLRVIRVFLDSVDAAHANLPAPRPTRTLTFRVPLGEPSQRWLLHTDKQGRERVTPLSPETHIATPERLVKMLIKTPLDVHFTPEQQHAALGALMRGIVHST